MYPKFYKGNGETAYYRVDSTDSYTSVRLIHEKGTALQIALEAVSGAMAIIAISEIQKFEQLKDFSEFNSMVNNATVKMKEMCNYLLKVN